MSVDDIHCHHKKAKHRGGTDEYSNLVLVDKDVHKLLHAKTLETIEFYINLLNIKSTELRKVNRLRQLLELPIIVKERKSLTLSYKYEWDKTYIFWKCEILYYNIDRNINKGGIDMYKNSLLITLIFSLLTIFLSYEEYKKDKLSKKNFNVIVITLGIASIGAIILMLN